MPSTKDSTPSPTNAPLTKEKLRELLLGFLDRLIASKPPVPTSGPKQQ